MNVDFVLKYILGPALVLWMLNSVQVYGQPANHPGILCISCHQRYSDYSAITQFFPCSKSTCHLSDPEKSRGPRNRYSLHLEPKICKNCHDAANGKFNIHSIHLNFEPLGINRSAVKCNTCHWNPEGYNSTHVQVPQYEDRYIAGSTLMNTSIRIPPWNSDCGYCHRNVSGARRLHDVHAPVLNITCEFCHGEAIKRLGLGTTTEIPPEKAVKKENPFVREFLSLFDRITKHIIVLYDFMVKK